MIQKHKNIIFCIIIIFLVATSTTPYLAFPCQKESFNFSINTNQLDANKRSTLHSFTEKIFNTTQCDEILPTPFFPNNKYSPLSTHPGLNETDLITVQGFITDAETEAPLKGATVFSYYDYSNYYGLNISHTTTDATGFYTLQLPANNYLPIIARTHLYYTNYSTPNATTNDPVWVNISLRYGRVPETSCLCGYITEKNTDTPIDNATIIQFWMNGNEDIDINFTQTNSLGYYECNVAYGFILIMVAFADGYQANYSDFTISNVFWVDWDETIWRNISLQKIPEGTSQICGYIKDQETGNPVGDASILLTWENDVGMNYERITYSDYYGFYKIKVEAGNGSLHIVHRDYYYEEYIDISVDENMTKWINMTLESIHGPRYHTYEYVWQQKTETETIESPMVEKKSTFEKSYKIEGPTGCVLTQVTVKINWEDDNTYGLLRTKGADTLTAEVTLNGKTLDETSELNGNLTFPFNVNSCPKDGAIEAKNIVEARELLNEMVEGKNQVDFDVLVTIETGEPWWRLFKYLRDDGNEFEMFVSYIYYEYEINEVED